MGETASMKKMSKLFSIVLVAAIWGIPHESRSQEPVWTFNGTGKPVRYGRTDSALKGAPKQSASFAGVRFSGRYANYTKADTWYPTWAKDGNLYSPWTDGTIGKMKKDVWSGGGEKPKTGYAKIIGSNPMKLKIADWGTMPATAPPFGGRYPCGSLVYNGVWYYGSYALDQPVKQVKQKFGWYVMGPFMGFHWSEDFGKTWNQSPCKSDRPLFDEPARKELDLAEGKHGPFIKMGAPHFVDFGKNMEHSPDGKAYLVGHGAEHSDRMSRIANNSWVTGDAVYMARVTPGITNMNDVSKYEFFAGHDDTGKPSWSSEYSKIKPVFSWNNRCGIVTVTYNPPLAKYFMCITDGHRETSSRKEYTSYILASDRLTGPWKMVAYMPDFGPQAYFLNIPSKFISIDGKTMWLCYSANYMHGKRRRNNPKYVIQNTPAGSAYSLSLHEFTVTKVNASSRVAPTVP